MSSLDLNGNLEDQLKRAEDLNARDRRFTRILFVSIGSVILVGLSVLAYFLYVGSEENAASQARLKKRDFSAPAYIANEYSEVTWKDSQSYKVIGKRYRVNYSFEVDGREYHGTSDLATKPSSEKSTAFYDPENPLVNELAGNAAEPEFSNATDWGELLSKLIAGFIVTSLLGTGGLLRKRR